MHTIQGPGRKKHHNRCTERKTDLKTNIYHLSGTSDLKMRVPVAGKDNTHKGGKLERQ